MQQWLNAEAHDNNHHHEHPNAAHTPYRSFCLTFDEPLDCRFNRWLIGGARFVGDKCAREGRLDVRGREQTLASTALYLPSPTLLGRWAAMTGVAAGVYHPRPRPCHGRGELAGDAGRLTTMSESRQT